MQLYEILIPVVDNERRIISSHVHKGWDNWVSQRIGGITILKNQYKGSWAGQYENMIPVRIACTDIQLEEILKFTIEYYEQDAVMCYLISSNVIIKKK